MLRYKYAQNSSNLELPFHIHGIMSDTASVSIGINGVLVGEYKPNMFSTPQTKLFTRNFVPEATLLQLLIVGSRQQYDAKENQSFFNQDSAVFVRLANGLRLYRDPDTQLYSWEENKRSKFYFNPHYFDSEFLWNLRVGYVPSGVSLTYQWPLDYEQQLFMPSTLTIDDSNSWSGSKDIVDIEPLVNDYFSVDNQGQVVNLHLDGIIELQTLKSGDLLEISNGSEVLSLDVKLDEETQFMYQDPVVTCRPVVHQDIKTINPNGTVHYAKGLGRHTQELITLTLYGKQVQFTVRRL